MDFELYDPPSTLVVPEASVVQRQVSLHRRAQPPLAYGRTGPRQAHPGDGFLNMGIIVNLSGRGGTGTERHDGEHQKYGTRNRIVNFTNINIRSIDDPDWRRAPSSNWNTT